jgi:hypothetical protein
MGVWGREPQGVSRDADEVLVATNYQLDLVTPGSSPR